MKKYEDWRREADSVKYERYQILSSARQELFSPESPVWVSRVQLSLDRRSGRRLLQARMVNCSDQEIRQIFLRVICLGAGREQLARLELVPLPSLSAGPGVVFGDDRPVEIPVKGTRFVEVFAQRVRFADGSAWDETQVRGYLSFAAAPVLPADPHYETLLARAYAGKVRNDCYFRSQQGLWICSCGLPNSPSRLRCPRCGADRLWLEQHMDPKLLDAAPLEKRQEPVPMPAPAVTEPPALARMEKLPPPTFILQSPPQPEPEEESGDRAGRIAALVLALLLFFSLGFCCAVRWLSPWLRSLAAPAWQAAVGCASAEGVQTPNGEREDPEPAPEPELLRSPMPAPEQTEIPGD